MRTLFLTLFFVFFYKVGWGEVVTALKEPESQIVLAVAAGMRGLEAILGKFFFYKDDRIAHFTDVDREKIKTIEKTLDRIEARLTR